MFVSSEMWRPAVCVDRSGAVCVDRSGAVCVDRSGAVCVDRSGAVCLSSIFNGWPLSYPTGKVAGT